MTDRRPWPDPPPARGQQDPPPQPPAWSATQSLPAAAPAAARDADIWSEHGRRLQFLGRVAIFELCSPLLLLDISRIMQPRTVEPGTVVCAEGDPGDAFYLVELGTLLVMAGEHPVARLGPGEFFGEMALLSGAPRAATVRAETAAELWAVPAADFQHLLDQHPALKGAVERAAALRRLELGTQEYGVEHHNLADLLRDKQEVRIGRDRDNDVVLDSRVVSAHHAVVRQFGDQFVITDLGSRNGTYVNGAEIRRGELKDGDAIWIGDQRLSFDRRDLRRVVEPRGIRIDVTGLRKEVKGGKNLLQDITLSVLPGEFVAIVGGSGAGKSTLMDAMSGVRPATGGQVRYNAEDYYSQRARYRTSLGYVPQDDIIHLDLPLRVTLDYAARLRLPPDTSGEDRASAVDGALDGLGLDQQGALKVGRLSGGQRKRASIGVELLTQPRVFFLDEPTSGLDPATDLQLMELMRELTHSGSTVVLTTHATKNVVLCDKVVFLARGGYLAYVGPPSQALEYFETDAFDRIYVKLAEEASPAEWAERFRASPLYARLLADQPDAAAPAAPVASPRGPRRLGARLREFAVLSGRNTQLYLRNPGRIVPLFVQPIAFSLLLIALFRSGLFEVDFDNPTAALQLLFIFVFTTFLFGLLYGIQEIVKEFPIFRRERLAGLGVVTYLLSKTTFLAPVLVVAAASMTLILSLTDHLPSGGFDFYAPLLLTLILTSFVGLSLALFTSSVAPTSQTATDLLSIWIMPQVLFSGAIFPVPAMNAAGRAISHVIALRWSFEAVGQVADLPELFAASPTPIGQSLLLQYETSFAGDVWQKWLILAVFIVVPLTLAAVILRRRTPS